MSTNDKLADALDELCDAVRVYDRCPDKYNHNAMTEARAAVASLAAPPAQGEWPEHRACVPYKNGARLVGFVIEQGDEAYGDIGLTEPLCWLARMCKQQPAPAPVQVEIAIGETIVVADLATNLGVKCVDVVKALFKMGVLVAANQSIDHDTAELAASELGFKIVDPRQPPAPGETELSIYAMLDKVYEFADLPYPPPQDSKLRAAIAALAQRSGDDLAEQFRLGHAAGEQAALAQQRVPDAVRELPEKWRKDARELGRSGDSSEIWNRTSEQRADELESALATIDQQQEARGNGE